MSTTYYPDFSKLSQYSELSGTIAVRYGADAPLTELELNEVQLIQNKHRRDLTRFFVKDGLSKDGIISFENGTLKITNTHAFIDGYHVYIDSVTLEVSDGQSVYLNIFEQQLIGPNDTLNKYGHVGGVTIENYIMDARYGQEISKRVVVSYEVSTSKRDDAKWLEIGTVADNEMIWHYADVNMVASGASPISLLSNDLDNNSMEVVDTKEYLYVNAREIPFTPEQLAEKRDAGDFSGLEIGDYVVIELEGTFKGKTIIAEIAGMDIYYGYSTDNLHSIDFVIRDALCSYKMHSSANTIGGFEAMQLYSYLQTTIWNCIPERWRNVIKPKKVLLEDKKAKTSTSWDWKSLNLWLLADIELTGYSAFSQKNFGLGDFKQYPLFRSERHLIKKVGGKEHYYWLIQPGELNSEVWCVCNGNGHLYRVSTINDDIGVVFGFRI